MPPRPGLPAPSPPQLAPPTPCTQETTGSSSSHAGRKEVSAQGHPARGRRASPSSPRVLSPAGLAARALSLPVTHCLPGPSPPRAQVPGILSDAPILAWGCCAQHRGSRVPLWWEQILKGTPRLPGGEDGLLVHLGCLRTRCPCRSPCGARIGLRPATRALPAGLPPGSRARRPGEHGQRSWPSHAVSIEARFLSPRGHPECQLRRAAGWGEGRKRNSSPAGTAQWLSIYL